MSWPEGAVVGIIALARTAFCIYRAGTQSITIDEATTYLNYVRDSWTNVWSRYDPNNHVLYSLLAQFSVRAFHISEFSLRLPSVLAGFFLVFGFHRVLIATVPSAIIRCIAVIGFSLAPLMLDFSIAARGYSLGLALLVWAIYFSISGRDVWAGVFAGLSLATTLNLAFAVIALVVCPLILDRDGFLPRLRRCFAVAVPAAVVFMSLWGPLLLQLKTSHFYVGLPTITAAVYTLVALTVTVIPRHAGWIGTGDGIRAIQYIFLPALMIFIVAVSARTFWREKPARRSLAPIFALLLSISALILSHFLFGLNYPDDRLGLYLFVLFTLAWAIAASQASNFATRAVNTLLALLLIAQLSTQIETRYFTIWQLDSAIDKVAARLRDEVHGEPPASVSVSATWYLAPAVEFYRLAYHITALRPVERHVHTELSGFNYYVLDARGDDDVKAAPNLDKLVSLFHDDFSGVLLGR